MIVFNLDFTSTSNRTEYLQYLPAARFKHRSSAISNWMTISMPLAGSAGVGGGRGSGTRLDFLILFLSGFSLSLSALNPVNAFSRTLA